jgi:hypothetical protein
VEILGFALHKYNLIKKAEVTDKEANKMKLKLIILISIAMMFVVSGTVIAARGGNGNGGPNPRPVVYVESQGLFYDSIVTAEPLPYNGHNGHSFQKLYMGPMGLTTMYGPGDREHRGGRWWLDVNGNGVMDPEGEDHYFG